MPLSDTNVAEQMQSKHPVSAPVSDAILRKTMSSFKRGERDPREIIISERYTCMRPPKKSKSTFSAGADGVMPYLRQVAAGNYRNDRYMDAFTQVITDYAFGSRPLNVSKSTCFKHKQFGAGMRDATALVANLVDVNLKRSDRNVALVIDIANAFNSVRRDKLLHIAAVHMLSWCF
ncbi:hypothetical protein PCE1_004507 [Barthelona sp. PCE]